MEAHPSIPEALVESVQSRLKSLKSASETAGVSLSQDPSFRKALETVLAFSEFVAKTVIRDPGLLGGLIRSGDLQRRYAENEYRTKVASAIDGATDEPDLKQRLRRLRNREMVRIAWRDIAGLTDLSETMADLSAFADACLGRTLSILFKWQCRKYGAPKGSDGSNPGLVIIGLGKLGGCELNFSSDIDLIFAYPEAGETAGGNIALSNEEFFMRLCRQLIRVLGESTTDGFVFRVDMRLRPFGEYGPLVMSFDAMDSYYQGQGREWERYAWIKARVVAGDQSAGGRLINMLRPFVYRRYLDYGAFESLRDMKLKISLENQRKGIKDDIKIGPGGIREIEFFGQVFQLIRGGVVSVLQDRSILNTLKKLADGKFIPQHVCDELTQAYVFLRTTEHRLQEYSDRQTHQLPVDAVDRLRLAASIGFEDWHSFLRKLDYHRETVHFHFNALLAQSGSTEDEETDELRGLWQDLTDTEQRSETPALSGFESPDEILRLLVRFRRDLNTRVLSRETKERIDKLVPLVMKHVRKSGYPVTALNRILDVLKSIEGRACYLALLLENPATLAHLVKLAGTSPWVVSFLSQHPVVLDELLDPRTLYHPPEKSELESDLRVRLARIPRSDLEYQMEELCIFKQSNTLRVVASDITGGLPLMKVSDHLSYIAETILNEVLKLSWRQMLEKHGRPTAGFEEKTDNNGFAVIAYGKLGGIELGYGSDLDLVFLHAGESGKTKGGRRPIDNTHFYARLGQQIIHMLTAHTTAGVLYDIDMRLRPSGDSGILASHIDAFEDYMTQKAWTWEHQALIRARAICGDDRLSDRFARIRKTIIALPRNRDTLRNDVSRMRRRMRRELLKPDPEAFDLKQDKGGIVDIEFIVQYLVLLHSHENEALTRWSDNVRLLQTLSETGIIDSDTADLLKSAYLTYRSAVHSLSLQEKPAKIPADQMTKWRKAVKAIWRRFFENS